MTILLKSMTILASFIAGLQAMQEKRDLFSCCNELSYRGKMTAEKENPRKKMWLMKEYMEQIGMEQDDGCHQRGQTLYPPSVNLVLDAEMIYRTYDPLRHKGQKYFCKVKKLI